MNYEQRKDILGIIELVAEYYQLTPFDLYGLDRHRPFVTARQMAWKITRELHSDIVLSEFESVFCRSHSTILPGIKTISDLIDTDRTIRADYKSLMSTIRPNSKEQYTDEKILSDLNKVLSCENIEEVRIKVQEMIDKIEYLSENNLDN